MNEGHRETPRLSPHARLRCEQMGVRTRRVKRIAQAPDMTWTSRDNTLASWSRQDPELLIITTRPTQERPAVVVLTVLPRTYERYERPT